MYKVTSKFKAHSSQFKAQGTRLKAAFVLLFYFFTFLSFPLPSAAQDFMLRNCRMRPVQHEHHRDMHPGMRRSQQVGKYVGERRQLVVLATFSDKDFSADDPVALWGNIFNAVDYSEAPFVGSVHDYFYAQSYGQLSLTFDLLHLTVGPLTRYHSTSLNDENSQFLIFDIADQLATIDIDWPAYDWDGDGNIDQLLVIYAGKGQNAGGGSNTIWPHQWWLSEHVDPATGETCQPRQVTAADGSTYIIDSYCVVQELDSDNSYGTFGTICHEYTHCFGFPDFYNGSSYVSSWDLMDYGNNNGGGYRPCGYSAHERWLMGWLTPVELSEPATVSGMAALADEPQAYLIRNDGYADEYYIVENRQRTGWDAGLPGSGIVVFHIDYDNEAWTGITYMPNTATHQRYIIVAANNRFYTSYRSGWSYPYETNDCLTDTSTPAATLLNDNSDGTRLMHKPLTAMKVDGALASFDFMGGKGESAIRTVRTASDAPDVIYDMSGRRIRRPDISPGLYIVNGRKTVIN